MDIDQVGEIKEYMKRNQDLKIKSSIDSKTTITREKRREEEAMSKIEITHQSAILIKKKLITNIEMIIDIKGMTKIIIIIVNIALDNIAQNKRDMIIKNFNL